MVQIDNIKTLIIKEISGKISPEEKALLDKTLEEHPELNGMYKEMKRRQASSEVEEGLAELKSFNINTVKETVGSQKGRANTKRKVPFIRIAAGIAAALVVTTGIFWWNSSRVEHITLRPTVAENTSANVRLKLSTGEEVDLGRQGQKQLGNVTINNNQHRLSYSQVPESSHAIASIFVPAGKDYTVLLSDGTEIQLNSGSSLTFPLRFATGSREITINGEAYLNVAKRPEQPFIVHLLQKPSDNSSNSPTVRVLGTQFNVNTYDASLVRVSLVEGSVLMKTAVDSVRLKPGLEASCNKGERLVTATFDKDEVLSWRQGIIELKEATLADVFRTLPIWYGVRVAIDDPSLNQKAFTGSLDRNKPVTSFLNNLKFTHDIEYYTKDGVIHIKASLPKK